MKENDIIYAIKFDIFYFLFIKFTSENNYNTDDIFIHQ